MEFENSLGNSTKLDELRRRVEDYLEKTFKEDQEASDEQEVSGKSEEESEDGEEEGESEVSDESEDKEEDQ